MNNGEQVDLALIDKGDFYDIEIAENGDIQTTKGLDTSLIISFFTDRRAFENEVSAPQSRRGWWGNLFKDDAEPELGSKIWLLDQSVNDDLTLSSAISYTQEAYDWVVMLGYADSVNVTGERTQTNIFLKIKIVKNNDVINEKVYDLWRNTVENILNS